MTATTASPSSPAFFAKLQRLGKALDDAGDADLIDHLRELARARRPHQPARLCESRDHGLGLVIGVLIAAAHHGQRAVLRAGLPAGHRRIDEGHALRLRLGVQFARNGRRGGRVVDEDRALLHARERAVWSEHDGAQIVVVADAGENEIAIRHRLARRRRGCAAVFRNPVPRLRRRAVIDRQVVTALGLQMARHRKAHDAQPEKCDLRHAASPVACGVRSHCMIDARRQARFWRKSLAHVLVAKVCQLLRDMR